MIASALMKQKTTKSYEVVLNAIVDAWKRLGLLPAYKKVFVDFEQAELKAAMGILGANVRFYTIVDFICKILDCFILEGQRLYLSLLSSRAPLREGLGQ